MQPRHWRLVTGTQERGTGRADEAWVGGPEQEAPCSWWSSGSPGGDLVLLSVHHAGRSGHPDRVLHVLHVLAQVGAPDGDAGASVHRPCQRLHLFRDKDCSPVPTWQPLAAWGAPPGPPDPQQPILPPRVAARKGRASVPTHRVDEGGRALGGHSLGATAGFPGHAARTLALAPHAAVLGRGGVAVAAVPVSHGAVIEHHWGRQRRA